MILNLAKTTVGDALFHERWRVLGEEYFMLRDYCPIEQVTTLIVDFNTEITVDFLRAFPSLKYLVTATTGLTHIKADLKTMGIELISLKGENRFLRKIHSVSEHVFNLILQIARPSNKTGYLLHGKTILILGGKGRIGSHVKKIAKGFGLKVEILDKKPLFFNKIAWNNHIKSKVSEADIITIHVPESKKNNHLISKRLLDAMKEDAILINTSRPSLIDEEYLFELVKCGKFLGLGLDVSDIHEKQWREGVYEAHRRTKKSVVCRLAFTNHVAGNTVEDRIEVYRFIKNKYLRVKARSESLENNNRWWLFPQWH